MWRGSWEPRLTERLEYDLLHMLEFSVYLIQNWFIFFSSFCMFVFFFFSWALLCVFAFAVQLLTLYHLYARSAIAVLLPCCCNAGVIEFLSSPAPMTPVRDWRRLCFTSTVTDELNQSLLKLRRQLANNNLVPMMPSPITLARNGTGRLKKKIIIHTHRKKIEPAELKFERPSAEIDPNELPRELPASIKHGDAREELLDSRLLSVALYYQMDSVPSNRTKQLISWSYTDKVTFNWLSVHFVGSVSSGENAPL